MYTREIGRERPKALPVKMREKNSRQTQMDKDFSWDEQEEREKHWACLGVVEAKRQVDKRCSQQTKMVGEQQG